MMGTNGILHTRIFFFFENNHKFSFLTSSLSPESWSITIKSAINGDGSSLSGIVIILYIRSTSECFS